MLKAILTLSFILTLNSAHAAKSIGEIIYLRGDAFNILVKKKSKNHKLKKGDKVFLNDEISTKKRTVVQVKMVDESILTIGPMSDFKFQKFHFSKDKRLAVFSLIHGQLRSKFSKRAGKNEIIVKTKSASMGVRGTEFLVNSIPKGNSHMTQVALIEGKVRFTSVKDKKIYDLLPGATIVTMANPTVPVPQTKRFDLSEVKLQALASAGLSIPTSAGGLVPVNEGDFRVGSDGKRTPIINPDDKNLFLNAEEVSNRLGFE